MEHPPTGSPSHHHAETTTPRRSYYILGVVLFVILVAAVTTWRITNGSAIDLARWTMGYFFLVFGSFKMIGWPMFAHTFQEYDIIAKRLPVYAWVYPALELALAAAFITNHAIVSAEIVDVVIMGIGLIGIWQALHRQQRYRCACLGSVIQLPLSTVSLIEDVSMATLGLLMLLFSR